MLGPTHRLNNSFLTTHCQPLTFRHKRSPLHMLPPCCCRRRHLPGVLLPAAQRQVPPPRRCCWMRAALLRRGSPQQCRHQPEGTSFLSDLAPPAAAVRPFAPATAPLMCAWLPSHAARPPAKHSVPMTEGSAQWRCACETVAVVESHLEKLHHHQATQVASLHLQRALQQAEPDLTGTTP